MSAADAEKEKLLTELGLTWGLMSDSKGKSATDKMPEIIRRLSDSSSTCRTQLNICSALISWMSVTAKEAIEETMLAHSDSLFAYILRTIKSGGDSEPSVPDAQTPAYYLTSCIQRQMKGASSPSFPAKMTPPVLAIIRELTQSGLLLKEKVANGTESNVSSRTESAKSLVKCLPTDDDTLIFESITTLFPFMKLTSATATPTLRKEVLAWFVAVATRDKTLFNAHITDVVGAMRFGEADDLAYILKDNVPVFTTVAPDVLEKNLNFLLTGLGFPTLSEALLRIARTESGATKLSSNVFTLTKDIDNIKAADALPSLMEVLIELAIWRPESVGRHIDICLLACSPPVVEEPATAQTTTTTAPAPVPTPAPVPASVPVPGPEGVAPVEQSEVELSEVPPPVTSLLLLSMIKLLAAVSRASVEDTYASLTHLTAMLRCGKVKTVTEQSALIGAIDVAKNKCPKGDVFADDTLASLSLISATNRVAYANLIKWNTGKWALEGDLLDYLECVDRMASLESGSVTHSKSGSAPGRNSGSDAGCLKTIISLFASKDKKKMTVTTETSGTNTGDTLDKSGEEGADFLNKSFSPATVVPSTLQFASNAPEAPMSASSQVAPTPTPTSATDKSKTTENGTTISPTPCPLVPTTPTKASSTPISSPLNNSSSSPMTFRERISVNLFGNNASHVTPTKSTKSTKIPVDGIDTDSKENLPSPPPRTAKTDTVADEEIKAMRAKISALELQL